MRLVLRGAMLACVTLSVYACGGDFTTQSDAGDGDSAGDGDLTGDGDGDVGGDGDGDVGGDGDTGGTTGDGDGDTPSGGTNGDGDMPTGGAPSTGGQNGTGGRIILDTSCPTTPPDSSRRCISNLTCTYGDDPRLGCREQATCGDKGEWQVASPECVEVPGCTGAGMDPIFSGVACDDFGDTCYVGGSSPVCVCIECVDEPCDNAGEYSCFVANAPCPTVPPNLGQPCDASQAGTECEYARCPSPHHAVIGCSDGTWSLVDVACPNNE